MEPYNISKILDSSIVEKDTENNYRYILRNLFPNSIIISPVKCDGLLYNLEFNLSLLLEFKFDETCNLSDRVDLMIIMIQVNYYLKLLKNTEHQYPSVIMIANKTQMTFYSSSVFEKYLNRTDIDWSLSPSHNCKKLNSELLEELISDSEVKSSYVYEINDIKLETIKQEILQINNGTKIKCKINIYNVNFKFQEFCSKVLMKPKIRKEESSLFPSIFLTCLINPDLAYLHPNTKNNILCYTIGGLFKSIKVDRIQFESFFSQFDIGDYTIEEKRRLGEIFDRLIHDDQRRFSGSFFTPTMLTNLSHELLDERLGKNWKEEYVVWDCCCGTGNLTRDYSFSNLFLSTLEQSELDYVIQNDYNINAEKFQYDFLSELTIDHCPNSLKKIFNDPEKKILFLINPPFKDSSSGPYTIGSDGRNKNIVSRYMISSKMGNLSDQLYAQFLSKIYCLSKEYKCKINVAFFSPFIFYTSTFYHLIRNELLKNFKLNGGFIINGSDFFNGVSSWPISFSLLQSFNDIRINNEIFRIITNSNNHKEKKILLNNNKDTLNYNIRISDLNVEAPTFSSGLNCSNKICRTNSNILAYLIYNTGNTVGSVDRCIYILSSPSTYGKGYIIIDDNILTRFVLFSSRKLVDCNWINYCDIFQTPNFEHEKYKQFESDSIIFTLFSSFNQVSAMRNISVGNKTFQVFNKLFWKNCEEIKSIADIKNISGVYNDCIQYEQERIIPELLRTRSFSGGATDLLNKANEILIDSFNYRNLVISEHPDWHLNTWDAGWYQIRKMMKKYNPSSINEFDELYTSLRIRMQPLVYELGFLEQ